MSNKDKTLAYMSYPDMTPKEFAIFANFVESHLGIKMPDDKQTMLQSRLQRRLRALKMANYQEYIEYVFHTPNGEYNAEEMVALISAVTTNKTEFFRESDHFTYMINTVMPGLLNQSRDIEIWSAGCSTGEEPYTLTMVMEQFKTTKNVELGYNILATDISSRVLEIAKTAIYPLETVNNLSETVKKNGFLRSRESEKELVRVKPELRSKVRFKRLNFMDDKFDVGMFHIIFCRNVLIYFEKAVQEQVIRKLSDRLYEGGYLFLGHSETTMGMNNLPLNMVAPTTYCKI
jgi:chemotaxis protein methyltransferase CheR